ncbi:MAG: AmmeMemoRadiSam system protein A, partial [Gammaproteobacteria bacterium]|nr:AmmeMemoRadiSam system protein A [Gammaproteobacteria bacterium]
MGPTASTERPPPLAPVLRAQLLDVARRSIEHGLATGRPWSVSPSEYPPDLKAVRASFVTLQHAGQLRGCIGHLEAVQPLVVDVAENAFAAAFRDPRFRPLSAQEWPQIDLHLSILTPAEPMRFRDEADLIQQLQPGEDGLILQDGPYRGTFLPSVWESLPDPVDFLVHLKHKAGL